MSDFKIVFVHGYTASSKADWYPAISKELNKLGIKYVIPDLPGGEHPHASEWLEKIHHEVKKIRPPIVLVGHSLGTRAVLLYLEKYPRKVHAVFLIAAFANRVENAQRYDKNAYSDFFEHKIAIEKIKSQVGKFIVIHSKDDPLDYEQGVEIANDLGAKLITANGRGHLSEPESASYILEILHQELNF